MTEIEPDYSKYSREDLHSVLSHIDRRKYPERVKRVKDALYRLRFSPAKNVKENSEKTDGETAFYIVVFEIAFWVFLLLLCFISI